MFKTTLIVSVAHFTSFDLNKKNEFTYFCANPDARYDFRFYAESESQFPKLDDIVVCDTIRGKSLGVIQGIRYEEFHSYYDDYRKAARLASKKDLCKAVCEKKLASKAADLARDYREARFPDFDDEVPTIRKNCYGLFLNMNGFKNVPFFEIDETHIYYNYNFDDHWHDEHLTITNDYHVVYNNIDNDNYHYIAIEYLNNNQIRSNIFWTFDNYYSCTQAVLHMPAKIKAYIKSEFGSYKNWYSQFKVCFSK